MAKNENLNAVINSINAALNLPEFKKKFRIPNDQVAMNVLTMDQFDQQMEKVVTSYQQKKLAQSVLTLIMLALIYNSFSKKETPAALQDLLYLLIITGLLYSSAKISERYSGWSPLFLTNTQSDLVKLNNIRRVIFPLDKNLDLQGLKVKAKIITDAKLAQCYELCLVTCANLHELEDIQGKYITQLALTEEINDQHQHTLIVISDERLNLEQIKQKTIAQLTDKSESLIFVDPWYDFTKSKQEIQNEIEQYPLLSYKITGIDYSAQINNQLQAKNELT